MGYDCTLHLVDERAIREQLVPRLLGESNALLGPFEKQRGAKLLASARKAVLSAEADDADRARRRLLVGVAAASRGAGNGALALAAHAEEGTSALPAGARGVAGAALSRDRRQAQGPPGQVSGVLRRELHDRSLHPRGAHLRIRAARA